MGSLLSPSCAAAATFLVLLDESKAAVAVKAQSLNYRLLLIFKENFFVISSNLISIFITQSKAAVAVKAQSQLQTAAAIDFVFYLK